MEKKKKVFVFIVININILIMYVTMFKKASYPKEIFHR